MNSLVCKLDISFASQQELVAYMFTPVCTSVLLPPSFIANSAVRQTRLCEFLRELIDHRWRPAQVHLRWQPIFCKCLHEKSGQQRNRRQCLRTLYCCKMSSTESRDSTLPVSLMTEVIASESNEANSSLKTSSPGFAEYKSAPLAPARWINSMTMPRIGLRRDISGHTGAGG